MSNEWVWRLGADKIDALVKEAAENDGWINDSPVYLDLRLGNLCNFRCRMCNPYNSSSIAKEHFDLWERDEKYKEIYQSEYGGNPTHLKDQATWFESDMLWDQVEALIPSLKKVYMTGGEPTLIENNYYFMEKCIEMGRKDIVLFFNTNCSNLTDKFLNILSKFDKVSINASVDGFGKLNDYIRYPSHWEKISANFEKLAQLPNIDLGMSPVVQVYNVFDIDKIIDYVFEVNKKYNRDIFIDFLIDTKPRNLDVKILPDVIRQAAKNKLENYLEQKFKDGVHDYTKNSTYAILNLLTEERLKTAELDLESFKSYTSILDKNRKQNFEEVCIELNEHLKKYYAQ
jgi:MoaA/NifB/PqqE/SkfB family radical SAM enzyme